MYTFTIYLPVAAVGLIATLAVYMMIKAIIELVRG